MEGKGGRDGILSCVCVLTLKGSLLGNKQPKNNAATDQELQTETLMVRRFVKSKQLKWCKILKIDVSHEESITEVTRGEQAAIAKPVCKTESVFRQYFQNTEITFGGQVCYWNESLVFGSSQYNGTIVAEAEAVVVVWIINPEEMHVLASWKPKWNPKMQQSIEFYSALCYIETSIKGTSPFLRCHM